MEHALHCASSEIWHNILSWFEEINDIYIHLRKINIFREEKSKVIIYFEIMFKSI